MGTVGSGGNHQVRSERLGLGHGHGIVTCKMAIYWRGGQDEPLMMTGVRTGAGSSVPLGMERRNSESCIVGGRGARSKRCSCKRCP